MDRVLMASAPAFCSAALPVCADSAEPRCAISQSFSQSRGCSFLAGAALGSPRPLPLSASGASHLETPNVSGGSLLIRRPGSLLHRRLQRAHINIPSPISTTTTIAITCPRYPTVAVMTHCLPRSQLRRLPNLHNPDCHDAVRSGLLPKEHGPDPPSPHPPMPWTRSGPTFSSMKQSGRAIADPPTFRLRYRYSLL